VNAKLQLLQRKMDRQQAPAPTTADDDLTAAIQRVVDQRVEQALEQQQAKQPPPQVQRLLNQQFRPAPITSFEQLPPVPRTRAPKAAETQLARDELGRVNKITVGTMEFYVQRNELGQAVRVVPSDTAPMPPVVQSAAINEV
jgi:hypothetical protein